MGSFAFKVLPEQKKLVTVEMDEREIEKKSQIYDISKIAVGHKMFNYYNELNKASLKLALDNPALLNDKNKLTNLARKLVHDSGYTYKKKSSRSKQFGDSGGMKRQYLSESLKVRRLQEIREDIDDTDTQLSLLTRQREKHITVKQFGHAASVTEQMSLLRGKKRRLEEELTLLQAKKKKCDKQNTKNKVTTLSLKQGPQQITSFFSTPGTSSHKEVESQESVGQKVEAQNTTSLIKTPSTPGITAISQQVESLEDPEIIEDHIQQNLDESDSFLL